VPHRYQLAVVLIFLTVSRTAAQPLDRIRVSDDRRGFILAESEQPFTPWGFNYDHDRDGRLIEDYWFDEWESVEQDFVEMKQLGANVVRVHLQFGKFMDTAAKPNQKQLAQLGKLLDLADRTGLYLDITGLGCYHKQDVPAWYDAMSEAERWNAQAAFWEAIAKQCAGRACVFCYDLMNEPVSPGGNKRAADWLGPGFAGKHFVQRIGLERKGRDRTDIARQWIERLVKAVRKHDQKTLITVGLVPWSLDRPGLTSGFVPSKVTDKLDFIAMHIYPEKGKVDEAIETLKGFNVGKPVVIEETFSLKCGPDEWSDFIDRARPHAVGVISFYWGQTPEELKDAGTLQAAILRQFLDLFQKKKATFTP